MLTAFVFSTAQKQISTVAWVALGLVVLLVLLINLGLIFALRRKNTNDYKIIKRFETAIRNPNQLENEMLDELSERVKHLKKDDLQSLDQ